MPEPVPKPIDPKQIVELALAVVSADRFPHLATVDDLTAAHAEALFAIVLVRGGSPALGTGRSGRTAWPTSPPSAAWDTGG